jgi:hypothetical protein
MACEYMKNNEIASLPRVARNDEMGVLSQPRGWEGVGVREVCDFIHSKPSARAGEIEKAGLAKGGVFLGRSRS